MNSVKLRGIDLFCGAGGSSYGAQKAGVQIVAGFDIWEPAQKAFKTNFPDAEVFPGDIREIKPLEVHNQIGDIDIILASPECTNHSKAKGAGERCEDSRKTAFEVLSFAQEFKPTWIVIENVIEMCSWGRYKTLLDKLKKLKYYVREAKLNAKDFGVPQSRERLFILCSRLGKPETQVPPRNKIRHVRTVISENTYKFTPLRKKKRAKATLSKADHAIRSLGPDAPFLLVYYGSGKNGNGGWQRLDEPLRTITTLDRFGYVIPDRNGQHKMRMLQPEELKLAMGFKKDFKLDKIKGLTRRERVKLMGNGVCPPVMEAIVKSLLTQKSN